MSITIIFVNIRIIVDKVFIAGIVRRVDIDYVNFAFMCECESRKCIEVIPFD